MSAPPALPLTIAGTSRQGARRRNNEDAFLVGTSICPGDGTLRLEASGCPEAPLPLMVSDGMGGGPDGEVASRIAVETAAEALSDWDPTRSPEQALRQFLARANERILSFAVERGRGGRMGATATVALVLGDRALIGQVGDSRAYLFREGRLHRLTRDQSVVAELVASGAITEAEALVHPHRNVLLQALGVNPVFEPVFSEAALAPGDTLLLCTDGLTGALSETALLAALSSSTHPTEALSRLVDSALASGADDDLTVLLAVVGAEPV